MTNKLIKNIPVSEAFPLAEQVSYLPGQIVSRTLAQNGAVSLTLFAFDAGEEISSHKSHGDALVSVLDGAARVTIGDEECLVGAGEAILMQAGIPHAVFAPERFKMILTVVFPK